MTPTAPVTIRRPPRNASASQVRAYLSQRPGPTEPDPEWAKRRVFPQVVAGLALLLVGALLAWAVSGCGTSPAPATDAVTTLPPVDTPPLEIDHASGNVDLAGRLASGELRVLVRNEAVHGTSGDVVGVAHQADAAALGEDWGYCLSLEIRVDGRPGLLIGLRRLVGDSLALVVASVLTRGDLVASGVVVATPDSVRPLCEARHGKLAVRAIGIDLVGLAAASASHSSAPAATE